MTSGSPVVVSVEDLAKRYRIGVAEERSDTLVGVLTSWFRSPLSNYRRLSRLSRFSEREDGEDVLWALRGLSFTVEHGEVVGVIGPNGAGKSTLLKILSRITEPTSGRAVIQGRVSSLLEVGTGFHPELTGRENIYLNGTVLGMTRAEVDRQYESIVEFAEVRRFIETPVKRYSSGMKVRLAFAVAAHLDPEVLLIDEVLAVGDIAFQNKCLNRMQSMAGAGRAVLFVSHDLGAVSSLCDRVIVLWGGTATYDGPVDEGITHYLSLLSSRQERSLRGRDDREGTQKLTFVSAVVRDGAGQEVDTVPSGTPVTFDVGYEISAPLGEVAVQFNVYDALGRIVFACRTKTLDANFPALPPSGTIRCAIPRLPLAPGQYSVLIAAKEYGLEHLDRVSPAFSFQVVPGPFYETGRVNPSDCGAVLVDHEWSVTGGGAEGSKSRSSGDEQHA